MFLVAVSIVYIYVFTVCAYLFVYAWHVCVCVCERERGREKLGHWRIAFIDPTKLNGENEFKQYDTVVNLFSVE